jgi:hypothetical protein
MDHILSTLGLDFAPTSARASVMKRIRPGRTFSLDTFASPHRDSLLCAKDKRTYLYKCSSSSSTEDDDTMSTLSESTSECSLDFKVSSVTFAHPLVTATHVRPCTTLAERSKLFYTEAEYREFRYEYIYGRRKRKRVTFSSTLVSNAWEYEAQGDKACLYYGPSDLQRFLDDFVESLNENTTAAPSGSG